MGSFNSVFNYYRVEESSSDQVGSGNATLIFDAEIQVLTAQTAQFEVRGIGPQPEASIVIVSATGNSAGGDECTYASIRLVCSDELATAALRRRRR